VAANGQFILIRRDTYEAVGGHAAVAGQILEDVALARAVKTSGRKIRFRYAADRVRTRMYRNFQQLREGWTKNLVLLFPNPGRLALKSLLLWAVPWTVLVLVVARVARPWWWSTIFVAGFLYLDMRLRRAKFATDMTLLGVLFGIPMFAYLLLRSKRAHATHTVSWKGRTYAGEDHPMKKIAGPSPTTAGRLS
jgi:hypothetical protein